jgi:YD repeat-containing protein
MLINTLDAALLDQLIAYDASDRAEYIGIAQPGRATDGAAWQIKKLTYDASGNVTAIRFAEGNNDFVHVWDDRATYDYTDVAE